MRPLVLALAALLALTSVAAAATREVRVGADGRLGVDLEDAPLEWVLNALGAALEVEVVVDGSLPGTVSARFEGLAAAPAVRRLVGSAPLLMRWTAAGELRAIQVRGEPTAVTLAAAPVAAAGPGTRDEEEVAAPPVAPAAENEGAARALDRQLAQRVRQLQADWRRAAGTVVVDDLGEKLAEDDPGAPHAAIRALARQGDGAAAARLGELLATATDPALRRLAIGALAGIDHPHARDLLEAALQ